MYMVNLQYNGYGGHGTYENYKGELELQFRSISGTGRTNYKQTVQTLTIDPDAVTIVDNNMIIIIINKVEIYVFPIKTIDNHVFVKYTTSDTFLTSDVLPYGIELGYEDDDLLYPTHESLQLLYEKTNEILNDTFYQL